MKAEEFLDGLREVGFDFFTGVPCSYFAPFCRLLEGRPPSIHVAAVREDLALGVAAGAFLAGKRPVVYMQNSGFGYSLEVFASLQMIYRIPVLVLVSYRGPEDPGWEEHLVMGEHTEELVNTFRLNYSIFHGKAPELKLGEIAESLLQGETPYILLVTKGALQ